MVIDAAINAYDKAALGGRDRPCKRLKPRPAKQPSATDRRILDEIKTAMSEGTSYRAARRVALGSAVKRNDLLPEADRRTDRPRIDRWWERELKRERELEQLKQRLVAAMLGAPRPQNGT
jgi:hypothetical protein